MASDKSYSITINNNKTEKEAINYLLSIDNRFINPDKESRKDILDFFNIEKKYSRAFDLIMIEGYDNSNQNIIIESSMSITLIELKTTRKKLSNLPKGFFFGATESEFQIAERLKDKFKFCFVSLHPETLGYHLVTLNELENLIKTRRIQYQINL